MKKDHQLPVEWNAWRSSWLEYVDTLTRVAHADRFNFGRANFLADEILGQFRTAGGAIVELSEVTFRMSHTERYIGWTMAGDSVDRAAGIVSSFAELDSVLADR